MKKKWNIISQIIAVILFMWSLYELFVVTSRLNYTLSTGQRIGILQKSVGTYGGVIKGLYVTYLTAFIAVFAGVALMYEKKSGWITATIASVLYTGFFLVNSRNNLVGE